MISYDALGLSKIKSNFEKKMKGLLESGKNSDVTIVLDGNVEIFAHRLLLTTVSPVFEAMFSNKESLEVLEKRVVIDDVPAETFKDFLTYIYTGVTPTENRLTTNLLAVADKVQSYYFYFFIYFYFIFIFSTT